MHGTKMHVNQPPKRILKPFAASVATVLLLALILCSSFLASPPGSAEERQAAHLHRALAQSRFLAVDETAAASASGGSNGRALLKMLPFGGRLGDQMFMYASTLAVASRYNMDHCMVHSDLHRKALTTMFAGPFEFCEEGEFDISWNGGGGSGGQTDLTSFSTEEAAQEGKAVGIYGFMHWADNFMGIKDRVFKAFTLLPEMQTKADEYLKPYGDAVRVGIHVRRGDKQSMASKWNAVYYEKAMDYFRKKYATNGKQIIFIVASDGKDWIKAQEVFQKPDVKLIEGTPYQEDMAILINCDHGIVSGGGFGFWFAFLGPWQHGGEVIMNENQEPWSRLEEWTFIEDVA